MGARAAAGPGGVRPLLHFRSGYFSTARPVQSAPPADLIELGASDLDERRSPIFQGRASRFRRRLEEGHELLAILEAGRVASYFWISPAGVSVPLGLGVSFVVPEEACYIWDCRTDAASRGRGLYRGGLLALRSRAVGRCGECLIAVEWSNAAAISAMQAAGFEGVRCRYRLARAGPFGLYVKDGAPRPFLRELLDLRLLPR